MAGQRPGFPVRLTSTAPGATRGRQPAPPAKPPVSATPSMASDAVRARMVQRLAAQGIADARVLRAMGAVERHRFVDSALVNQAYEDTSLPIGLGQTISKPNVVYSIERLRGLHERARANLRPFRLATVHLLLGDGMLGYAKGAPYAAIVAAAGGEDVPDAWVAQLAVGGRIVAPMVSSAGGQALVVIDKTTRGLERRILEAVHFVPLKSGIA